MSAAEVVEKAKAEGRKFDVSLVHKARRRAVGKVTGGKKKTTGTAARSTSSVTVTNGASQKPAQSKAEFVRRLPLSTPAKEVIAQAKAAGISISETHIYGIRSAAKAARTKIALARKSTAPTPHPAPTANASSPAPKANGKAEDLLRAVAAELGLGTAIALLQDERARVRAVIGG